MKIKVKNVSYEKLLKIKKPKRKKPKNPNFLFRWLVRFLSKSELKKANFTYTFSSDIGKGPHLILMNHSSFIDLKIASHIFKDIKYNVVSTTDALVGKEWLMRNIGCIPTQKFVHDLTLINDIRYALSKNRSVLMSPEAGYSFDGTATALPRKMGVLLKKFDVPVIMIETFGAFSRNPLYNELQIRKDQKVSAKVRVLFTQEEIREKISSPFSSSRSRCSKNWPSSRREVASKFAASL